LLDKFASMGRMEMVSNAVTMLASYGGRLMFILQALSTLDEHYGKDGREVILQNCAYQVFFAASDETTTKYVVNRLGKKTVKSKSITRSKSGITKADKESARDLMLPQEFQGMDRDKSVILIESGRPVLADKIRYYEDEAFTSRVMKPADVPLVEVQGNHRAKPTPVPDAEHPGEASKGANALLNGTTPEPPQPKAVAVPAPAQEAPVAPPEAEPAPATPVVMEPDETPPATATTAPVEGTDEATVSDDAEQAAIAAAAALAEIDGKDDDIDTATTVPAHVEGEVAAPLDDGSDDMDDLMNASADTDDEVSDETEAAGESVETVSETVVAATDGDADVSDGADGETDTERDRQEALYRTFPDKASMFNNALAIFGSIEEPGDENLKEGILALAM